ncbi:MAG: leucine-rich repeat protein, partial [Oscillospiraceae bacterium]|nr:leucine-rich repeat protein [Oscillospiraceae bacterium]
IPGSVNKNYLVTEIGEEAFSGCEELKKVVIPNRVKVIRKNAFLGCNAEISICARNKKLYIDEECTQEYTGDLKNGPSQDVYLK